MTYHPVELVAANPSQKPVFENLLQLYLYDMAAQSEFPLNAQGRYGYDLLDRFWEYPYLIQMNGKIAGFCMVISHCPIRPRTPCWFMAEFCILRPYRRLGAGRAALAAAFARHPGEWEISWGEGNTAANGFWPAVIPDMRSTRKVAFDGVDWVSVAFTV
jgi:predicted acetyltransferase